MAYSLGFHVRLCQELGIPLALCLGVRVFGVEGVWLIV